MFATSAAIEPSDSVAKSASGNGRDANPWAQLSLFPFLAFGLLMVQVAHAGTITGQISLTLDGKPLRATEAVTAVVYFRPATPIAKLAAPKLPYVMRTERKQFVPSVLPVIAGSTISFPNNDPILHNAFSSTPNNVFDTGLYGKGEGETVTLNNVGIVRVYCNVHHSMTASILVLPTPYFAQPNAAGQFVIKDVPNGAGELFVWHERATLWRKSINIGGDLNQPVALQLVKKRIPPHLNKFGKPYRRSGEGGY